MTAATAGAPVVISGMGALTPLGPDLAALEEGLLSGRSGARLLEEPEFADLPARIAATVDLTDRLQRVEARTLDRVQQVALVAAREAWADAGAPEVEPTRLAVVIGSGIGGALTLLSQNDVLREKGPRRVSPHLIPMLMPNGPAATVGLEIGARAGVHTPVSACASGAEALALALEMLRDGRADVIVAGGAEACVHPLPLAGFAQMRALSTRHDDVAAASRPYDKGRDGFVLGEGAGVLVLETEEHAAARGARIHGRLAGAGLASDAHHVTAPDPAGTGAARSIELALRDAGVSPSDVGHVDAHATSTPLGDLAEARALNLALGDHRPPVTAPKSCTGHLLGAAGAVEAIAAVLALKSGVVPAIRNLEDQDDDADVDAVRTVNREHAHDVALSTSFGFGGHDVSLVLTK
ncbi:MAG: 3-oxoacyl-[acyl-carrier-protein] synthase, KASII [uncultured Frankineae bacterium]|uniref:3-oxoacyl-[acyl-carrier-protein] synthase, KASII n=1 Tax=uncultured Frankineae bacterium TaxID=437475 RepID=A0A6J4LYQ1_9ACTN|nr:MAG: 3-oxoacyl-[acyl-carrier-protein] synthase, KASII [uncultured Frankineae bacterium]